MSIISPLNKVRYSNMSKMTHREFVVKIKEIAPELSHEHSMAIYGVVAEIRLDEDRSGYKRGFDHGYAYALERMKTKEEHKYKSKNLIIPVSRCSNGELEPCNCPMH